MKDSFLGHLKENTFLHIGLLLIFTFNVYAGILSNSFAWDDHNFIQTWEEIHSFEKEDISAFFSGSTPPGHAGVYRPLRSFFYTLSYFLFGLNPLYYHLQAILIHLVITILMYIIIRKITSQPLLAFLVSLLFAIHPLHTEAVSYITSSFDLIGFIFFFVSFYLYLAAQDQITKKRKIIYSVCSLLCALLAALTYELTLTLPLFILLYELSFNKNKKLLYYAKKTTPYLLITFSCLLLRFLLHIPLRSSYFANSITITFLLTTKALLKYIILTILPLNLSVNPIIYPGILSLQYGEAQTPLLLTQTFFDPILLISLAVILLTIALALYYRKKQPLIFFSIGWFYIALLPVINIFPNPVIMAERYAYLASLGIILLAVFLTIKTYQTLKATVFKSNMKVLSAIFVSIILIVLLFYSLQTINRNADWQDDQTLWEKSYQQTPDSAIVNTNLGWAYWIASEKKDPQKALFHYKKAIKLNPSHPLPYENIATLYEKQGNISLAILNYENALELDPAKVQIYPSLAHLYTQNNQTLDAIKTYEQTFGNYPRYFSEYYFSLANLYLKAGHTDQAIKTLKAGLAQNSSNVPALKTLAILLLEQKQPDAALLYLQTAIEIDPQNPDLWNALGAAFYQQSKPQQALSAWQISLKLKVDPRIRESINQIKQEEN